MIKKLLTFTLLVCASSAMADPMWHCTASSAQGAVWNRFGSSHMETRNKIESECRPYNQDKDCSIVCFPPRNYWRCVSHDTLPPVKDASKTATPAKQGSWYWTSFSKQVAINGARDACRHNSAFGGCYVNVDTCATTKTN